MPFGKTLRRRPSRPAPAFRVRPLVEALESRLVPYSTSGNAWPHPELITLSFVPDGTIIGSSNNGYIYSNLFATFNDHPGWTTAGWEKQILKAAQSWAQQTNINFALVSDNGATLGQGSYQQGDPNMGDIRIGGYNFGNNYLAVGDMPPSANNYSIAGDIFFNTGQSFNVGSTYDLYSVAVHEIGHALGMDHSSTSAAVMYPTYTNVKTGLGSDDVSGIRTIYSNSAARSVDAYAASGNTSFATAANLTGQLDSASLTALVNNLDITTASQAEYFMVTAPAGTGGTLTVNVQSSGLSLLAPSLTVYAANQSTVLGSVSGSGKYGTTLSVKVPGVSAGQQFYVKVTGADSTAFGTGAYALTLNFGSGPFPTVVPPNTATANGSTLSAGGAQAESASQNNPLGNLLNTIAALPSDLLGFLLGISTNFGLGAGHGDPYEAGAADSPGVALPGGSDPAPAPTGALQGQRTNAPPATPTLDMASNPGVLAVLPNAGRNQTGGGKTPAGQVTTTGKGITPSPITGNPRPAEQPFGGHPEGSPRVDAVAEEELDYAESALAPTTPPGQAEPPSGESALPEVQSTPVEWWREAEAYFAKEGEQVTEDTTENTTADAPVAANDGNVPGVQAAAAAIALALGSNLPGRAEGGRRKLMANLVVKRAPAV
jgi:hypothetical protein